ncbi:MAG: DUF3893 domain-containing protein [Rubrivivax sp.]|nr:DUF3893 domain-containing protein [Rubrivivax sp.]
MSDDATSPTAQGVSTTAWRRSPETKGSDRPVLLGARIRAEWLSQAVSLLAVRLAGSLLTSLQSLLEAAKNQDEKNLPIVRLRAALMAKLEGVMRLDRDLGLKNPSKPALELRWVGDGAAGALDHDELRQRVVEVLMRWYQDVVGPWAARNGHSDLAAAVRTHITAENIELQSRSQPLVDRDGAGKVTKPQWDLIAKHLADRLVGEELFPGLGPCEVVADATSLDGAVELTTWPTSVAGSDAVFSMVARLSVATWPTSRELYLKVTPAKRVWAKKVPGRKPNAPPHVRCYIFSPEMPVLPATIRRGKDGWGFGDDYVQYRAESSGALPETLERAVADLRPVEQGWWVGLPELTTLFDYVQQRTVFEADEVDLYECVVELLPDVLDAALPFRTLKIPRAMTQAKSAVARLQVDDVLPSEAADLGWAGAALEDDGPGEDSDEEQGGPLAADDPANATKRRERLARHRAANEEALARIHGDTAPSLWVFVDGSDERKLIERSAQAIFGDRLRVEVHPLPPNVHGLRGDLDLEGEKGIRRFEARVERWKSVAEGVAKGADGARHVLICAPKDVNKRPEDPVNYYAGLHAMCRHAKANVHHLLPLEIDRKTKQPDVQHFIHRVQSALLDVFLAHSGMVFGVRPFVQGCLGRACPKAIYGVQAVRSQARALTQEQPVSLIVFTKLDVATGVTSVSFVCRDRNRVYSTEWLPLNQGLQWLGSQRHLSGDERWLKDNFAGATRKMLGRIHEDDPHAVVLIDWSTVAGLWTEITDESLIGGTARGIVLDEADLDKVFPAMTLLRLRADRNATLGMRWVNTTTFEEWHTEPHLVATRQTAEEQYATTYKTIVELDAGTGPGHLPHYLLVMGYRSTVQTKRGMSCYRPRPRMSRNKTGWFERRLLPVAKDNAALPGGLEVTVLQSPDEVKPDSLASLVMGLRLGYAHYDDWTALPAPLFFVRKVRDYIIRYPEAPDVQGSDGPPAEADAPTEDVGSAVEVGPSTELRSELVSEVLEELPALGDGGVQTVLGDAVLASEASVGESPATYVPAEADSPAATPSMEADETAPVELADPALDRALKASLAAPELYSPKSGPAARLLYEGMLLGTVRVRVDPPWFVTRDTVLSSSAWPTDKRAIGRYWRQIGKFNIRLRPERGEAPSVAQFPEWVMRRLAIPQSLYALDIADLFPSRGERLFHRIEEVHRSYLEAVDRADEEGERGQLWRDMPDLVKWLCKNGDDEALGWVFCLMAHYPYKEFVPKVLQAVDPAAMGAHAHAALEYMTNCHEVCHKAYDDKRSGDRKVATYTVPAPMRPLPGVLRPGIKVTDSFMHDSLQPPVQHVSSRETGSPFAPPGHETAPIAKAVAAISRSTPADSHANSQLPASTTHTGRPAWPTPGDSAFDDLHDACQAHLDSLKRRHEEVLQARAAELQAEQTRQAQLSAQAAAEIAARAAMSARLDSLDEEAHALAGALRVGLEVGQWHAIGVRETLGEAPGDAALAEASRQMGDVRAAVQEAEAANAELARVDAGEFEGSDQLGAKERARKKGTLLQAAAQRATEADAALNLALDRCSLLASGPATPRSALEPTAPLPSWMPSVAEAAEPTANPAQSGGTAVAAPTEASAQAVHPPAERQELAPAPVGVPTGEEQDSAGSSLSPTAGRSSGAATIEIGAAPGPDDANGADEAETGAAESDGPARTASGPVPLVEPTQQVLLACLESGHWALAAVAARALNEISPGPVSRLWGTAVAAIRAAESRRPIEPEALKALQEWLASDANDQPMPNAVADHLGVFGASLLPMLLAGHDPGIRWSAIQYLLPRLQPHTELHRVVERIATLESIHLIVTPEIMSAAQVGLHQALEDGVRRMRERAASWPADQSLVTNWTATDYVDLHAAICTERRGFATGECVAAIARGDDARARRLLPEVQKLADKGLATITDMRKRIGRRRPIEGVGRDYMVGNLKTTSEFVHEFFAQLDRLKSAKQDTLPPKHEEFLRGLYRELQAAFAYVQDLDLGEGAAGLHRRVLLCAIERARALMEQRPRVSVVPDEDQLLLLQYPMAHDLKPATVWRLADESQTRVPLADIGQLVSAATLAERELRADGGPSGAEVELPALLVDAAAAHRSSGRLLPARLIEERLARSMKSLPSSVIADNDTARREARNKLSADLQEAKQRVTNAMSLNALPQAEASRMLKVIESLVRANAEQEIGSPGKVTALYPDFPHARAVLQHVVLTPLDTKIQQSREKLKLEIEEFVKERERNLEPTELRQFEQKAQRIQARLEQGTALSVRVARNEFLLLREDKLPLFRAEERTASHRFEEFRTQVRKATHGHRVLDGLRGILKGDAPMPADAPDWLSSLGDVDREEAVRLIGHWCDVFKNGPRGSFAEALENFFRDAGLSQDPAVISPNEGKFFFEGKPFAGLAASGFGVFVPPALGSDATHIEGVIVPQPSSIEKLGQSVAQLPSATPTFLLSRQSLTAQQRAQLGHDHPVLIVDDDLVAYMAVHPSARLAKLMEVCLLSFRTNPYADYGARPVPPEMFFGRVNELRKLREVPSAAVLYGGRRLGKSSLLNQILEESRSQVRLVPGAVGAGEMAIYVPLDSGKDPAGFSQNYRLFGWKAIHKAMVTAGFLASSPVDLLTDQAIRDRIHDEIVAGGTGTKACYLLIDEADDVMREDLRANAPFLASLQNLSDTVLGRCRLRYVIAGLHNLTRMTTGGNTALGKATSIALQPFSSDTDILNGIDLITKPLAALGFHFGKGDESLPMRIMAVCNFYPAFIQLYCRNLVNRLYNKRAGKDLATSIGSGDLDAVERDQEFLREIQEKFGLNLNLDKRYKAIALILAEYSYAEAAGSVFAGLTATEIRDHCVAYAPEHFKTTAPGAYEALLDEMEKLTILERNGSRYQLRTPDIATMLGDHEQVAHHLNELARETPTEDRSRGEARLSVSHRTDVKTFPMPSAWVRNFLQSEHNDLVVFVGNQLSGIAMFDRLREPWDLPQDEATIEAKTFSGPEDARTWLNGHRKKPGAARTRLVAVLSRGWRLDQLDAYVALAQTFGRQTGQPEVAARGRLPTMRPMLVADPEQAFGLAARLSDQRRPVSKNLTVAAIPAWSDDAVYFRFDQPQHENVPIRDSAEARHALLTASCGLGDVLERICGAALTVDEALRQPDEARKRLAPDLLTFYAKIGWPASIDPATRSRLEDLLILMHGEGRAQSREDEHLEVLGLTPAHFLFAQWMGLVQQAADGTWEVPNLYLDLIEARPAHSS